MPLQDYAWMMLNTTSAWTTTFVSAGTYARYLLRFSLSGLPHSGALSVLVDDEDIGWQAKPGLGLDRWHYDIKINQTLAGGEHEVAFTLKNADREGVAQLCSVEILEFGDESE